MVAVVGLVAAVAEPPRLAALLASTGAAAVVPGAAVLVLGAAVIPSLMTVAPAVIPEKPGVFSHFGIPPF